MKKVGITGGIGCGKSTVAMEFRALGVPCFVSDIVAAAYYNDIEFLDDLRRLLGDGVFLADGSADKRAVAARVFADRRLLNGLNSLVHPRVMADFDDFCRLHAAAPYVLFAAPAARPYRRRRHPRTHRQPDARRRDDAPRRLRDSQLRRQPSPKTGKTYRPIA